MVTCTGFIFLLTTPIKACTHDLRRHITIPKINVVFPNSYEFSAFEESSWIFDKVIPTMQAKQIAIAIYSIFTIGSPFIQWANRDVQKGAKLNRITEMYIGTIVNTQIDIMKLTLPTIARNIIQGK